MAHSLAVHQREILRRADPRHIRLTLEVAKAFARPAFPLATVASLLDGEIGMGTSTRTESERVGLPVVRTNNLTFDGLDTTDLKYLDLPAEKQAPLLLRSGDLLINRANGSIKQVGKTVVFDLEGDWLYASFLYRLRLQRERVLPAFLAAFLNSPGGRIQIERLARPITLTNINKAEIASVLVPLPNLATQASLLTPLSAAGGARRAKRAAAAIELVGINTDLEADLGGLPPFVAANTYGVRAGDLARMNRMGVSFFHPDRQQVIRAIAGMPGVTPRRLDDVVDFIVVKDEREDEYPTLGLAAIEQGTGQLLETADEPEAGKRFERGDVLWSRLRPNLNKVAVMDRAGRCSPEFHVLRPKGGVRAGYLAAVLRSPSVLRQLVHVTTGSTHPRVLEEDAKDAVIPIPSGEVQAHIEARMSERAARSGQLRDEAERDWAAALATFGACLLR